MDPAMGKSSVAVVTDSTAYLPDHRQEGVEVVPLHVVVDGKSLAEGVEIAPAEIAKALRQKRTVSTSRPSPRAFLDVYEALARRGASAVVSVHLSGELSGTLDAARLAVHDAPIPVTVVDSRSVGMGLGFAVLAAAEAARRGLTADEVAAIATDRAARGQHLFMVATLEYLRRGGRVNLASAVVGAALAIKPLLHMSGGAVVLLEKVRTAGRAQARLIDIAVERAGSTSVDVAVHHLDSPDRAEQLARELRNRIPAMRYLVVSEVGAVVGAHIGPGALGVVISPC